jgi:hypothetical protein
MKAYILSKIYGTVQIGRKIYQPATNVVFSACGRPWQMSDKSRYEEGIIGPIVVPDQSMDSAKIAILKKEK